MALLLTVAAAVLLLGGCEDWFPQEDEPEGEAQREPEPERDTAPSFAGTVADDSYTVGEAITPLMLPAASGGTASFHTRLRHRYPAQRSLRPRAR